MKYCRVFETESNYTDFVNGSDYVTPNLCVIRSTGGTKCKPYIPPPPAAAGDVAYWDGSSVKTTPLSSWNTSLGTPVGVVVIIEGFAPDGKARIVSLKAVDSNGNASTSHAYMKWGTRNVVDTSLINHTKVPITTNSGNTSSSSSSYGYLPSDNFTGDTSYVDSSAKYNTTNCPNKIPSPYIGSEFNEDYSMTISGNNALSDFNGLSNTEVLMGLDSGYTAANAAYKYKDGASNTQWYLPSAGELGFLVAKFKTINSTISTLSGVAVTSDYFWSSTEYSKGNAYYMSTYSGSVDFDDKDSLCYVRPFAILNNNDGGVTMISFTVGGVQYQAEEGMTWGEWVNSEYNTSQILVINGTVLTGPTGVYILKDNRAVLGTDILINNMSYTVYQMETGQ